MKQSDIENLIKEVQTNPKTARVPDDYHDQFCIANKLIIPVLAWTFPVPTGPNTDTSVVLNVEQKGQFEGLIDYLVRLHPLILGMNAREFYKKFGTNFSKTQGWIDFMKLHYTFWEYQP